MIYALYKVYPDEPSAYYWGKYKDVNSLSNASLNLGKMGVDKVIVKTYLKDEDILSALPIEENC